jgi:hypothetical protein
MFDNENRTCDHMRKPLGHTGVNRYMTTAESEWLTSEDVEWMLYQGGLTALERFSIALHRNIYVGTSLVYPFA